MKSVDLKRVQRVVYGLIFGTFFSTVFASEAQDRLIKDLFQGYDKLSRPVEDIGQRVTVQFGLTLNILVYVSDKEQVMKTNGYLDLLWNDTRLKWDPAQYGGLENLRLPIDKLWQPDVALTNTVDKQFYPSFKCNAVVLSSGTVQWLPPFIFRSGCDTDPLYFPFDQQLCYMVFRSMTYSAHDVDLVVGNSPPRMELKDYCEQPSGTWDLAEVPLLRMYRMEWRRHGQNPVVFVQLNMKVARKSQFYVVTFLLPCVCIAFLTIFVFHLPTAGGEKVCLAISILFSIVVFLLILVDILPPSDSLPLMMKFLVFTFVCNLVSMFITIITINFNFRTPQTHTMSRMIKLIFLEFLPTVLRIRRPAKQPKRKLFEPAASATQEVNIYERNNGSRRRWGSRTSRKLTTQSSFERMLPVNEKGSPIVALRFPTRHSGVVANNRHNPGFSPLYESNYQSVLLREMGNLGEWLGSYNGYPEALQNVAFIAKNMEEQEDESEVADDWKYISLVIDRLLLWVFFIGNAFGSVSILLNSPHLFQPLTDHCPQRPILVAA